MNPRIGKNVTLRHPTFEEVDYIKHLWACPETNKHLGGPYTMQDGRAWYERWVEPGEPSRCYFLVVNREGEPVGEICYHSFDLETGTAYLGMKIEAPHQGRKYASVALQLFTEHFFLERGGRLLLDDIALDNVPGQQALLKFGFEHDASVTDVFLVKLTNERFLEKKTTQSS
ncbi:GNAT family N-acetyltransferase [Tumebacillus flagellatus]|uniref:N-acetyltransferase domain-containing protein n=1 Tax=Tumebacillus flagellatus TaxID=1157490 RepID=A0A074LM14_9BACL|nr:GNAT family N-acetyltransferase [Tumebacillus flagellatus]KEO83111.1 hypothetical protein EL26_11625 [Tumebacillus flagellatus]